MKACNKRQEASARRATSSQRYHLDVSVSHTSADAAEAPAPIAPQRGVDSRYLHQIINTVSSTLDLDRVLRAIVEVISDAIDCHACFIYFVDPDDGSLTLRSVSDPYGGLVGRLRFEHGEGLAGWVAANNQPVFLGDNALADPRVKIVPEAEEEDYQSLVAVPLNDKSGTVIGVIALHAEAPREFTQADSDFLMHSATLVAGAIENARLYQDTRRRLALVEGLADLARAVADAARAGRPAAGRGQAGAPAADGRRLPAVCGRPRRRQRSFCAAPGRPRRAPRRRSPLRRWGSRSPAAPPAAGVWPPACGIATRRGRRRCYRWWPPMSWWDSSRCGFPRAAGWTPRSARSQPRSPAKRPSPSRRSS